MKFNLIKYGVFLAQLSLLPLLIAINPATAESINNNLQTEVSNSAKDLLLKEDALSEGASFSTGSQRTHMRASVRWSAPTASLAKGRSPLSQNNLTSVTGVKVDQTGKGLEVVLTTRGKKLVPLIFPEGNNLVIDILDATLAPTVKNGFTKTNPAPGIRQVRLTKLDESSIRLTIVGKTQTPSAEIIPSQPNSVVLNIVPTNTAQTQVDEEIEIIATDEAENNYYVPDSGTATRTDTPLRDIPQSVQIIPQQVIEDQQATSVEEIATNSSGVIFSGNDFGRSIRSCNSRL